MVHIVPFDGNQSSRRFWGRALCGAVVTAIPTGRPTCPECIQHEADQLRDMPVCFACGAVLSDARKAVSDYCDNGVCSIAPESQR